MLGGGGGMLGGGCTADLCLATPWGVAPAESWTASVSPPPRAACCGLCGGGHSAASPRSKASTAWANAADTAGCCCVVLLPATTKPPDPAALSLPRMPMARVMVAVHCALSVGPLLWSAAKLATTHAQRQVTTPLGVKTAAIRHQHQATRGSRCACFEPWHLMAIQLARDNAEEAVEQIQRRLPTWHSAPSRPPHSTRANHHTRPSVRLWPPRTTATRRTTHVPRAGRP